MSEFLKDYMLPDRFFKNRKIKIALLTNVYSRFDGVGRAVEQQAKELSSTYDVTIFALEADMRPPKNVKLRVLWSPKSFTLNRIYRLFLFLNLVAVVKYIIDLAKYDVLIAHLYPLSLVAYLTKKLFGVRYIKWHHHTALEGYNKLHERLYMKLIEYFEERSFIVKGADVVCSISEHSRRLLLEKGGVESIIVYNKIDDSKFKDLLDCKQIRERYRLGNSPILLFVGRIHPQKNIHELINVFKMVKERAPNAKLIIVGKPINKKYYEKIRSMADDSVIFAGYVPDEELPYYYAACDVYVTCSLSEGFNLPLVEAQKCGKPVVAFDIGPHREIVTKGALVKAGDIKGFVDSILKFLNTRDVKDR